MAKTTSTRTFKIKPLTVLNIVIILVLAGAAGYFFKEYNDLKNQSPEKIQERQVKDTINAVGKLYSLPKDETPDVATVKDKEALKKQYPFFDQAENDDVVLIYKDAQLAILYRPSTDKLVKVGPVNVEAGVVIRTVGSDTERAAIEKILEENKLPFTSGGTSKTAITGTVVVDVKGSNAEQAKRLAEIVKGTVAALPEGEDKPDDTDLLILVGPAVVNP